MILHVKRIFDLTCIFGIAILWQQNGFQVNIVNGGFMFILTFIYLIIGSEMDNQDGN